MLLWLFVDFLVLVGKNLWYFWSLWKQHNALKVNLITEAIVIAEEKEECLLREPETLGFNLFSSMITVWPLLCAPSIL